MGGVPFVAGVYPLRLDETCHFLAVDFDKADWRDDALAFAHVCRAHSLHPAIERSRSGQGAHVWMFFEEALRAALARRLGAHLLTEAMDAHPVLGFGSYDRLFPNQDTLPQGGFGNLIALPLQRETGDRGNTVFVDDAWEPLPDQWAYLSSLRRAPRREVEAIVQDAERRGRIVGVRLPPDDQEDRAPWTLSSPARPADVALPPDSRPARIEIVLAEMVYVPKRDLPSALRTALLRLAAFQNPSSTRRRRCASRRTRHRASLRVPRTIQSTLACRVAVAGTCRRYSRSAASR